VQASGAAAMAAVTDVFGRTPNAHWLRVEQTDGPSIQIVHLTHLSVMALARRVEVARTIQKQPAVPCDIEAGASSHRRGDAGVGQGHGYVNQQHHEPNQQYKGEQSPAEAHEGFYDEMLEMLWKFHRCVPRSYGDGRGRSQAVA